MSFRHAELAKIGMFTIHKNLKDCVRPTDSHFGKSYEVTDTTLQEDLQRQVDLAGARHHRLDVRSLKHREIDRVTTDFLVTRHTHAEQVVMCLFVIDTCVEASASADYVRRNAEHTEALAEVDALATSGLRGDHEAWLSKFIASQEAVGIGGEPLQPGEIEARKQQLQATHQRLLSEFETDPYAITRYAKTELMRQRELQLLRARYHAIVLRRDSGTFEILNHINAPQHLFPAVYLAEAASARGSPIELTDAVLAGGTTIPHQFRLEGRLKLALAFSRYLTYTTSASSHPNSHVGVKQHVPVAQLATFTHYGENATCQCAACSTCTGLLLRYNSQPRTPLTSEHAFEVSMTASGCDENHVAVSQLLAAVNALVNTPPIVEQASTIDSRAIQHAAASELRATNYSRTLLHDSNWSATVMPAQSLIADHSTAPFRVLWDTPNHGSSVPRTGGTDDATICSQMLHAFTQGVLPVWKASARKPTKRVVPVGRPRNVSRNTPNEQTSRSRGSSTNRRCKITRKRKRGVATSSDEDSEEEADDGDDYEHDTPRTIDQRGSHSALSSTSSRPKRRCAEACVDKMRKAEQEWSEQLKEIEAQDNAMSKQMPLNTSANQIHTTSDPIPIPGRKRWVHHHHHARHRSSSEIDKSSEHSGDDDQ
jgi:hypothetical protein